MELPHNGPTSKADCLNWVIQAIFITRNSIRRSSPAWCCTTARTSCIRWSFIFSTTSCPRKDLVQLPVVSLERNWYELVAATYMDEFAEWHGKDLPVRESISGMVPSAGVGTGFSRHALLALCAENGGRPFNVDSLTEDYDIGLRLSRLGMKSIFVRFPVQYEVRRRSMFGNERVTTLEMPLCVREFFRIIFAPPTGRRLAGRWGSPCRAGVRSDGPARSRPNTCCSVTGNRW